MKQKITRGTASASATSRTQRLRQIADTRILMSAVFGGDSDMFRDWGLGLGD
jgi:hypothetical protein